MPNTFPGRNLYILLFQALALLLLPVLNAHASSYPGLPTRSQNPMLQSYFIPAQPLVSDSQWSVSHSLYITNTYQIDQNSTEQLLIDVENSRYDLQVNYRRQSWLFNVNLSLISNRRGFLDQAIEDWHDFFGMPQGGRDQVEHDQIRLFYQKDGITVVDARETSSGLADIQLAAGFQLSANSQIWAALELPSSADSALISNDAIDLAVWYSAWSQQTDQFSSHGNVGVAFPADDGLFKGRLHDQFLFAQFGMIYRINPRYQILLQADYHSPIVKYSSLDALEDSLQMQFVLGLPRLFEDYQLDLFFSEDIAPGHAPDITFGLRLSPRMR